LSHGPVKKGSSVGKVPILRDGMQWRPFVHVRDTANAMLRLLDASPEAVTGEVFNIGANDQNYQILALAQLVSEAVGLPCVCDWYGSPDRRSYRVSFQKAHDTLGFTPLWTPREGAGEICEALRQRIVDPDDPRTITVGWYKQLFAVPTTV